VLVLVQHQLLQEDLVDFKDQLDPLDHQEVQVDYLDLQVLPEHKVLLDQKVIRELLEQ
jgi:hypothetical protein